ncbi:MAG: ABC transporter ATP-binding protein [Flexistipes sinusarabici]|uniref:ABC transporter ATP-binding protein n=1 Tax=Flexistipes sinusarabici TaxID=2352 RepID=A0A5D0MJB4_FLESI|nr:ABC transporter ATP-binding protein [Flexistipes sinusarabici]TYB33824.1 MAG: ABC transporter ATP-binding protein [Flexistipes sinusarabici]
MSHHYIAIHELEYTYPDGTKAVADVNLNISHGESVAILGSNGAGKSTLIKHLNGTILPTKGSVNIGGTPVTKKTLKTIRSTVGLVFQNTDNQLFMPSVFENVAFSPRNIGITGDEMQQVVEESLGKVDALGLIDKHPFKLSGGEKRKVCIASVIASNPEILVLDEPTAEIDPKGIGDLVSILRQFSHTKIISSHNLKFSRAVCSRGVVMQEGRIIFDGELNEIFSSDKLLEAAGLKEDY